MPVLALDVGERRIGVAVSDPGASFALPLPPVVRSDIRTDLTTIVEIANQRGVRTIVVGDPLRLSGERGIAAEKIDRFCAALGRAFDGTIERIDERLTTAQATRALISADVSRSKRKKVVDGIAAALILETYLATRKRPAQ